MCLSRSTHGSAEGGTVSIQGQQNEATRGQSESKTGRPSLIVTGIRRNQFGERLGTLNGREVQFTHSVDMWFYTDGSGYAYGARAEKPL